MAVSWWLGERVTAEHSHLTPELVHLCNDRRRLVIREAAAASTGDYTRAERESAWAAVARFAFRPEFAGDVGAAEAAFFDPAASLPGADTPGLREESALFFEDWLLCDFHLRPGRTAVDLYLERERARLRSGELRYLERVRYAHLRPYEVTAVRPGEGLDLFDLWARRRLQVREHAGTQQIVAWDILAARVMLGGEGVPVIEGAAYLFGQEAREPIVKELKRGHRRLKRAFPDLGDPDFFRRMARSFYILWLVHARLLARPQAATVEGDPLVLARVVFDVRDPATLAAALAGRADLARQDNGSYAWLEDGGPADFRRSLGTLVLQGKRLVFEVISRSRAERGRAMVEALAGSAVTHRATSYEDVDQALARHRARPRRQTRAPAAPPEVEAQVVGQFLEQHYRSWIAEPLPALDGLTPREAAALDSARPKLVSLLKSMESMSERQRRAGESAYDFGWMLGGSWACCDRAPGYCDRTVTGR
jgi:hypothetical protein